jgi:hypothetical protein
MAGSSGTMTARAAANRRVLRIVFGCLLVLAFLGSAGFILFNWPLPLAVAVILIMVAAASAAVFAAYFVPNKLSVRSKRAFTVGAAAVGLITTLIAVPAIQNPPSPPELKASDASETASQTAASDTAEASTATPSPLPDPITATLTFGLDCEWFTLPTSQLRALSKVSNIDAEWIYKHGGATTSGEMILIVQGKGEDAVVLQRLRVVELEHIPVPTNVADIGCDAGVGGEQTSRYLDIRLSNPTRVVSRPGPEGPDDKKGGPAAKFPYKVSNADPEYFEILVSGPPCFCRWRLALDWTTQGRKGTLIIDRGFDKIVTDTSEHGSRPEYAYYDNKWHPPLPK